MKLNTICTILLTFIFLVTGVNTVAQSVQRYNFSVFNVLDSNDSLLIAGGQILTESVGDPNVEHGYYPLNQSLLSIEDFPIGAEFTVYPNPCSDRFTIRWSQVYPENLTIQLYTLDGKLLQNHYSNSTSCELQCIDLADGIYFVKILSTSGTIYSQKLIKVN